MIGNVKILNSYRYGIVTYDTEQQDEERNDEQK